MTSRGGFPASSTTSSSSASAGDGASRIVISAAAASSRSARRSVAAPSSKGTRRPPDEARLEDARVPEDVPRGDADLDRRDRQPRGVELQAIAAPPRLALPALERDRLPQRFRRAARAGEACLDPGREGHPAAPRVVPDQAQEAVLALREGDLGPGQPLLGKVEEGPFGHEDRPARPVAASLEAEALQERRGEPRDAEAVDPAERAEVGLEAARALRLRDREERRADPRRLASRRAPRGGTGPRARRRRRGGGRGGVRSPCAPRSPRGALRPRRGGSGRRRRA